MTNSSVKHHSETLHSEPVENQSPSPKFDRIVKGVATGVAVSTVTQTCRSVVSVVVKNPLAVFVIGFAAGYFAHKYRKGILLSSHKLAEQGKDFVTRQKKNFDELLDEGEESQARK